MNTSNAIYISYIESVFADQVTKETLHSIIARISSNEFKNIAEQIRSEPDKEKQANLKKQVPAFFPCLVLNNDKNSYNEQSQLNGIIQFDIDTKDNDGIDFDRLRAELLAIEEIIYLFWSPRKGLKFGIKTDLKHNTDDGIESLQSRFKDAYVITEKYLHRQLPKFTINYDQGAKHKLACLLSHDPDAYFKPDCAIFNVDSQCVYKVPELRLVSNLPEDASCVQEYLPYISRDLGYHDRLNVNSVVINVLGYSAIPLLESHWTTKNRAKLRKNLVEQLKNSGSGTFKPDFGILVNFAKDNGWQPVSGSARNKLIPQVAPTLELPPLLLPKDASLKLEAIIQEFLADKRSRFINFSTGAGKTYTVLQILEEISWSTRILYLVKSHELAEEIRKTFNLIREERSKYRTDIEKRRADSKLTHLKGRALLCENDSVDKSLVPVSFCRGDSNGYGDTCMFQAECNYTLQFAVYANIRVMTHNEFVNQPAKYFNGIDADGEPRKGKWTPQFLIIDEDIFTVEKDYIEDSASRFGSIAKILMSVHSGVELKDAIIEHCMDIIMDSLDNKQNPPPEFRINAQVSAKQSPQLKYSELFNNITQYARTENMAYLYGMRVNNQEIIQSVIKPVAERYKDIPTLFLDATANQSVVARLLPHIQYHSINVKSKDDINLYQLHNRTFTKEQLKKDGAIADVIFGLKILTEKYTAQGKHVGLITYKTIHDITKDTAFTDFDAFLAKELSIDDFAHFGGLRGLNKFNDVDCLIILGRYCLPPDAIESNTWAIFNEEGGDWGRNSRSYLNSPVRMKDGSVFSINAQVLLNDKKRAVSEHYSLSETQQAIGRGRMIHGKPKDIYYLSNEAIGSDIEVTAFMSYDELFSRKVIDEDYKIIPADNLVAIIEAGFFVDTQVGMINALGLAKVKVQDNKERIIKELIKAGFTRLEVCYKDLNRKPRNRSYYVCDEALLMAGLKPLMKTLMSVKHINE
jgi:hypothetical protein